MTCDSTSEWRERKRGCPPIVQLIRTQDYKASFIHKACQAFIGLPPNYGPQKSKWNWEEVRCGMRWTGRTMEEEGQEVSGRWGQDKKVGGMGDGRG